MKQRRMRRRSRVDATQKPIIEAFRGIGCSVLPLHVIGKGCPDLLVSKCYVTALVECKTGEKARIKPETKEAQDKFMLLWSRDIHIFRANSAEDAISKFLSLTTA